MKTNYLKTTTCLSRAKEELYKIPSDHLSSGDRRAIKIYDIIDDIQAQLDIFLKLETKEYEKNEEKTDWDLLAQPIVKNKNG